MLPTNCISVCCKNEKRRDYNRIKVSGVIGPCTAITTTNLLVSFIRKGGGNSFMILGVCVIAGFENPCCAAFIFHNKDRVCSPRGKI
jgi:hypothetical protein